MDKNISGGGVPRTDRGDGHARGERPRGRKAGAFLLAHVVAEARAMKLQRLHLLTSHKCAAAIHLYEKAGFVHDATVMADYGARYARCDVAMSLPLHTVAGSLPMALPLP